MKIFKFKNDRRKYPISVKRSHTQHISIRQMEAGLPVVSKTVYTLRDLSSKMVGESYLQSNDLRVLDISLHLWTESDR